MSKFNSAVSTPQPDTFNEAGGLAFHESEKLELASILLTSFVKAEYYKTAEETLVRMRDLIRRIPDKKFVAQAAVLARTWGMRSITHVAFAELANCPESKGTSWFRRATKAVVQRPDDVTEIISYWMSKNSKSLPNSLKRGLGDGLTQFDEYQLAKYKSSQKGLKLLDAVNLTHPKYTMALTSLMKGTLEVPDTWETSITAAGSDEAAKRSEWRRLVLEKRLGYFALLRNLRNIETYAPEVLSFALGQLTDEEAIRRNKVFPFRFMTAIKNVSFPETIAAISIAADISLSNLPVLPNTMVALDVSGSMETIHVADTASLFAAAFAKRSGAEVLMFGDEANWARINPADSVTTIAASMPNRFQGTNFNLIFDRAEKSYDRIIILSDEQAWVPRTNWRGEVTSVPTQALKDYKSRTSSNPNIWSIDLAGLGTLQFPEEKVYTLAGFSERMFDLIGLIEAGGNNALIKTIESVRF